MGGPGERDEENCGVVMNEHLPEVLPLHVKELAAHVCVLLLIADYKTSSLQKSFTDTMIKNILTCQLCFHVPEKERLSQI